MTLFHKQSIPQTIELPTHRRQPSHKELHENHRFGAALDETVEVGLRPVKVIYGIPGMCHAKGT